MDSLPGFIFFFARNRLSRVVYSLQEFVGVYPFQSSKPRHEVIVIVSIVLRLSWSLNRIIQYKKHRKLKSYQNEHS